MKKGIAVLLAGIMALSLAACGSSGDAGVRTWYLGGNGSVLGEEVDPEQLFDGLKDTIEPAKIYNSVTFTEDMLYGVYTLNNLDKDVKTVRKEMPFEEVTFDNGTFSVSALPISVCFGADYISGKLTGYNYSAYAQIEDAELAILSFATQDDIGYVPCIYEVDGNHLVFKEIEQTSADGEPFAYQLMGNTFEYDFTIAGPNLTLNKGGNTVKLTSYCFTDNIDGELSMSAYSMPDSPLIGNLDCFASSNAWNYAITRSGEYYKIAAYKFTEDGKFTIHLESKNEDGETETIVEQYAYIAQSDAFGFMDDFRLILLDGTKQYDYTDDILSRESRSLTDQGSDVSALTEEEIQEIAEKKSDLFDDLTAEFSAKGINVTVNRSTGEIAMDASVLFAGDSAEITQDGKAMLNQFLSAYTSIIYNEKYDGFIAKTLIEGHTAPLAGSTYESGLPLSTERANTVKAYCLSPETGVDTSRLASTLEAVGLSNSKPVYNSDGEVDTAACRRVSFRFIVNV